MAAITILNEYPATFAIPSPGSTTISTISSGGLGKPALVYKTGANVTGEFTQPSGITQYLAGLPTPPTTYNVGDPIYSALVIDTAKMAYFYNGNWYYYQDNSPVAGGYIAPSVQNYDVATLMTLGPSVGSIAAVNDRGGKLAYWDITNNRWSFVFDNSAVV